MRGAIRIAVARGVAALLCGLAVGLVASSAAAAGVARVVPFEGPISAVSSEFFVDAIEDAAADDADLVILEIDTPGGLDTAMRDIVKAELASEVPVVVYVAPSGSRAASAGVFITMAAHVAAMAPGTNIGSASPVSMMGASMDSTMGKKVTNDAVAYLESIAEQRGRNVEWAARFVADAENIPAERALEENVIDLVAASRDELLEALDGREIELDGETVTLATADLEIEVVSMGWQHKLLSAIANPTVAYLLLLLGMYGIFFELSNPGSIFPGVVGALAILLALYATQALPLQWAGVALLALALVLFVLEIFVSSFGMLSLAGVAALVFGSAMLFDRSVPWARLSWSVIVPAVAVSGGFFVLCVVLAVRGMRRPVSTGRQALVGEIGRVSEATDESSGLARVVVHGEVWRARSDAPLEVGQQVRVLVAGERALDVEVEN